MLNMLGRVHRRQQKFLEAGERFMQALTVGFLGRSDRTSGPTPDVPTFHDVPYAPDASPGQARNARLPTYIEIQII